MLTGYTILGHLTLNKPQRNWNIPYNLIFTTKFNDSSILITIISWHHYTITALCVGKLKKENQYFNCVLSEEYIYISLKQVKNKKQHNKKREPVLQLCFSSANLWFFFNCSLFLLCCFLFLTCFRLIYIYSSDKTQLKYWFSFFIVLFLVFDLF
jgi:hypothetical protein